MALHFCVNVEEVSIQLISPASGDDSRALCGRFPNSVSIQLISPASGDLKDALVEAGMYQEGFHSTYFPSEWGRFGMQRVS